MGTYYHAVSGTRILSATRVDLSGSDDNPPAAQSADDLIIAVHFQDATETGKNPVSQAWSLEWENNSDNPGSWTALGNTGELTYNATTDLVNDTTLTVVNWACSVDAGLADETDGVEREGSNADITINLGVDAETEFQIAVDFSGADRANGDTYKFRIVDSTESQTINLVPAVTVTTASGDKDVPADLNTVTATVKPPAVSISASPTAAVVAATAAALAVVVSISDSVTAAVTSATASVLPPAVRIDCDVAPAPVTATAGIPPPAISADHTLTAAVVSATATTQPPTPAVTASPVVQSVTASVLSSLTLDILTAVDIGAASTITTSIPPPTVDIPGDINVAPAVLSITASVQPPVPSVAIVGDLTTATTTTQPPIPAVTVQPSTLDATAAQQPPAVSIDAAFTAPVLAIAASVLDPTVDTSGNVTKTPAVQTVTASVLPPSLSLSSALSVAAQSVTASVLAPVPVVALTVQAQTATATAQSPLPGVRLEPSTIDVTASVLDPSVVTTGDRIVQPAVLSVTASVLSPAPEVAIKTTLDHFLGPLWIEASVPKSTEIVVISVTPSAQAVTVSVLSPSVVATGDKSVSPAVLSITASVVVPAGVGAELPTGPWRVAAQDVYVAGQQAAGVFTAGAQAGDVFTAGAQEGEAHG
jgi:hypothetical protein